MAIELKMPALSPTMEKGTLAKWLVAEGDLVKAGDLIAEIETDKATMEFEVADDGRIVRLVVAQGAEDVAVGAVVALLAEAGEDVAAPEVMFMTAPEPMLEEATAATAGPTEPASTAPASPAILAARPQAEDHVLVAALSRLSPADCVRISPLAARIAKAKGINIVGITGTGPNGRIVRADLGIAKLGASIAALGPDPAGTVVAIEPPPANVPLETNKLSSMRKTIARRLSTSKQTVPHFYLTARCRIDPLLALREDLNSSLSSRHIRLSVNDMLIKALALALVEVPDANVQFGGDVLHRFARVDVSLAVAVDGGLMTPVIRDVGMLSLSAISATTKALAAKARDGKLMPGDYEGGTASLSNLGMFGIDEMFPVINPPQAMILGTAAGFERPWKVDGAVALATIMAATASFDHRAIDGAVAARFMQVLKDLIENPIMLCS